MKTKSPFEEKLLAIVEPVASDLGFEVVRLRVIGGARRKRLQVMAERAAGKPGQGVMTVDDCADLSRALSAVLDVADPFTGEWDLEVSSPGIDRPLTTLDHFARWEGFEAKLELDRMVEGRKRFTGELAGVEGDDVLIELKGEQGTTAALPFSWIAEAKLVLTDALIAESLKARGGPPDDGLPDGVTGDGGLEGFDEIEEEDEDDDAGDHDEDVIDGVEDEDDDEPRGSAREEE